jgi:small-conductance mechanosensitive channel
MNHFLSLMVDVWTDLSTPDMALQIGILIACFLLGWLVSRGVRMTLRDKPVNMRVIRLGVESFSNVLSPFLALLLIIGVKILLAQHHHINLLRLAIPLVASFVLIRLGSYILRRIFARTESAGSALLLFERVFAILVWIGVALYITGAWPEISRWMEELFVPVGRYKISLLVIAQAVLSVAVTLVLALWIGALLEERLMRMSGMHSSLQTVVARLSRALLILIAILLSLSLVGIDLTVLSVFGGALGVAIGLGLQKIISSYVSGFVILLERSLAIGDMVTINNYYGRVTKINARYTVIRNLDGVETVVPNDMLISGAVQNYSLSDHDMRLASQLTIGYRSDLEAVLTLLQKTVATVARVSDAKQPTAVLLKFGSDGLELEVGFWITDPENGRGNVLSDVNRAIWNALSLHNIEIPYPQREIHITRVNGPLQNTLPDVL